MYQTAGVGVLALILGLFLTRKIYFLRKMCIPSPVSGGIIFSLIFLALYKWFGIELSFNGTLKDLFMIIFFTSVGYQSNLRVIRQGGKPIIIMVLLVAVIIIFQNLIPVGIAAAMGHDPLLGMAAGSIPMSGGHGTAGGFSGLLEQMGLSGASSITMAAATFGLVAGSLIGGPLAEILIRRNNLSIEDVSEDDADTMVGMEVNAGLPEAREEHMQSEESEFRKLSRAAYAMVLAIALGTFVSKLLAMTGITFPTYFGSLLAAALMRNLCEAFPGKVRLQMDRIVSLGDVCLSLFLGMAMVSLRLWELAGMALPLFSMLVAQLVFMGVFAYFVAFPLLGRNYDAAVLVSGICGFGLGATPNAMANMSAVCYKYRYAVKPFIVVPIIGAMFADLINTTVITIFLNIL